MKKKSPETYKYFSGRREIFLPYLELGEHEPDLGERELLVGDELDAH